MALANAGLTRLTGTVTHIGLLVSGTEVAEASYARLPITWNAAGSSKITNNGALTFANADTVWGTVTEVSFHTAITAGDMLFSLALTTNRSVTQDTIVAFANAGLVVNG